MSSAPDRPDPTRRTWLLLAAVGGAVALVGLVALGTAPVALLLGETAYAIPSALHGVASILYLLVGTVVAYLALQLYAGRLAAYRELRVLACTQVFLSLATILLGNWIYIAYRGPEGPRAYFLEHEPAIHQVFFEFKEFISLFTFPLAAAAAYGLFQQGNALHDRPHLRQAIAVTLLLGYAFLLLAFGLGAAITKLRSV